MKHFAWAFLLALGLYVVGYNLIEHRRVQHAPWEVTFTNNPAGNPALIIRQPDLKLGQRTVVFTGTTLAQSNRFGVVRFDQPRPVPYGLPFGRCVFMDITFLPGSVTLDLFNHQVEMLPSRLIIDGRPIAWNTAAEVEVTATPSAPADSRPIPH